MKMTVISCSLPRDKDIQNLDVALTPRDSSGQVVNPDGLQTVQYLLWFQPGGGVVVHGGGLGTLRLHSDDAGAAILRTMFAAGWKIEHQPAEATA